MPSGRMSWMNTCVPKTFAGRSVRGKEVPVSGAVAEVREIHLGQLGEGGFGGGQRAPAVAAGGLDERGGEAFLVVEQNL